MNQVGEVRRHPRRLIVAAGLSQRTVMGVAARYHDVIRRHVGQLAHRLAHCVHLFRSQEEEIAGNDGQPGEAIVRWVIGAGRRRPLQHERGGREVVVQAPGRVASSKADHGDTDRRGDGHPRHPGTQSCT